MPLTEDFVTVLGEVTLRMCVADRGPLGVVMRLDEPKVALSYPDNLASRRAICSVGKSRNKIKVRYQIGLNIHS